MQSWRENSEYSYEHSVECVTLRVKEPCKLVSLFKYLHLYLFSPGVRCKSLGRGVPLGH